MARDFNGTTHYLTLGTPSSLNMQSKTFAVFFKIWRDGTWYLGTWHSNTEQQWLIQGDGTNTIVQADSGTIGITGAALNTTEWHGVGLNYNSGVGSELFIDGASADTGTAAAIADAYGTGVEIGRAADAVFADAKFAEFAIWTGVILSAAEHAALDAGVCPLLIRPQNLEVYLPLWGTGSPERDYSGNGVNATIQNSVPAWDRHPGAMPHVPPMAYTLRLTDLTVDYTDSATVYLDLQALVTEEYPVVPFDLTASGTELKESTDSATVYLELTALGGECHSTWQAGNLGSGEAELRWLMLDPSTRWTGDAILRWTEGPISVESVVC